MKLSYFLLIALIVLFGCNANQVNTTTANKTNESVHEQKDSLENIKQIDRDQRLFDKKMYASLYKEVMMFNGVDTNTVQLICFFDSTNWKLKDLLIKTITKDINNGPFFEEFYLDDTYRSITYNLYRINDTDTTRLVFADNRDVVYYDKIGDKIKVDKTDSFIKETKISCYMFSLTRYMSFFPNVKYNGVEGSVNSHEAVTTCQGGIVVRDQPNVNGKQIAMLPEGTHLFYLGNAGRTDTTNGNLWGWYKVAKEKKDIIGWIYGDPFSVTDLTDDNW